MEQLFILLLAMKKTEITIQIHKHTHTHRQVPLTHVTESCEKPECERSVMQNYSTKTLLFITLKFEIESKLLHNKTKSTPYLKDQTLQQQREEEEEVNI